MHTGQRILDFQQSFFFLLRNFFFLKFCFWRLKENNIERRLPEGRIVEKIKPQKKKKKKSVCCERKQTYISYSYNKNLLKMAQINVYLQNAET